MTFFCAWVPRISGSCKQPWRPKLAFRLTLTIVNRNTQLPFGPPLGSPGRVSFHTFFRVMNPFFRLAAVGSVALLGAASAHAQQNNRFTISGYVRDGATG